MFGFIQSNFKIRKNLRKEIFSNNINNLNTKDQMDQIIIKPGHFQLKTSIGSDTAEIIRVLGPDKNREGYWITQDGHSIPEYIIAESYVALDTVATMKDANKKVPQSIFAGLDQISNQEETEQEDFTQNFDIHVPLKPSKELKAKLVPVEKNYSPFIKGDINEEEIKPSFDITVLEKISIDNLNQKSFEMHGIEKYKKPIINIQIPIELNYDLNKLKQTIDLLELDTNEILTYIIKNIEIKPILNSLKTELEKLLSDKQINQSYDETINISKSNIPNLHNSDNSIHRDKSVNVDNNIPNDNNIIEKNSIEIEQEKNSIENSTEINNSKQTIDIEKEIESVDKYIQTFFE